MATTTVERSWEGPAELQRAHEVIVVGLGPVGLAVLSAALEDARFDVVGCIDVRPEAAAEAEQLGYDGPVYQDTLSIPASADVAVVCTASTIAGIDALTRALLERGCHVVSSCEELIAPQLGVPEIVRGLHEAATAAGKVVVGAGVNPGFVMDVLPFVVTAPTLGVKGIEITRNVDVAKRRERLQEKVGVGISLDEFARRREAGDIGHVGLRASLVFLANALGWSGESEESVEPVEASDGKTSLGVRHHALVRDAGGEVRVRGRLEMYAGATDLDTVKIDGRPAIDLQIRGGISGDDATVAALLNVAARAETLPVGLSTPADYLRAGWSAA